MKHLIICREYPPAPSGGIGTYAVHISRLLSERGETVHVIGQMWDGAEKPIEEENGGRLIVHRIPVDDWKNWSGRRPSPMIKSDVAKALYHTEFYPQSFAWQAGLLAEKLIEEEGIDIIEGQEFEAPLYFFQLRRALGLGPKRQPPCIVHLHSPMEFIVRHNDWDIADPYYQMSIRLEDYTIASADALLCPSQFLARQAEAHYGLEKDAVHVIPLPIGDSTHLKRSDEVWNNGTICYVGRVERRKGVLEWIEAAVTVADDFPEARFEFIGSNVLGSRGFSDNKPITRRIPKHMRKRLFFRDQVKRSMLPQYLADARIAVVPSRWENFPNTCVEAMCSGLPVIASPEGGMAEMVTDGETGWLACAATSRGLAHALKRALETPPAELAEMGRNAAVRIREICDNHKIIESHMEFRDRIIRRGAGSSLSLPVNLPWAKRPLTDRPTRRPRPDTSAGGLAIVITCAVEGDLAGTLKSIRHQSSEPEVTVIVDAYSPNETKPSVAELSGQWDQRVIQLGNELPASMRNAGVEAVMRVGQNPLGFVFLEAGELLSPDYIAVCKAVLNHCPEVGLVSGWTGYSDPEHAITAEPCPAFPYQWLENGAASFSAVRTEALQEAGKFRDEMIWEYQQWDLFNAVMAAGWTAVTVPEILATQPLKPETSFQAVDEFDQLRMQRMLQESFPDHFARDAKDIVSLIESKVRRMEGVEFVRLPMLVVRMRLALRDPGSAILYVLSRIRMKMPPVFAVWIPALMSRIRRDKNLSS